MWVCFSVSGPHHPWHLHHFWLVPLESQWKDTQKRFGWKICLNVLFNCMPEWTWKASKCQQVLPWTFRQEAKTPSSNGVAQFVCSFIPQFHALNTFLCILQSAASSFISLHWIVASLGAQALPLVWADAFLKPTAKRIHTGWLLTSKQVPWHLIVFIRFHNTCVPFRWFCFQALCSALVFFVLYSAV